MSTISREDFDKRTLSCVTCLEEEIPLSIMTGKGKLLIISQLNQQGPLRYSEIKQLFSEISNRILTKQLRELEQDKIITRFVYPEIPPRVEYTLTDHGKTLLPIIRSLHEWGKANKSHYFNNENDVD